MRFLQQLLLNQMTVFPKKRLRRVFRMMPGMAYEFVKPRD